MVAILVVQSTTIIASQNNSIEVINMSFSEFDVTRRTRKGNFLKQIDQLFDWNSIEKAIAVHIKHRFAMLRGVRRIWGCRCLRCYWSGFGTVVPAMNR